MSKKIIVAAAVLSVIGIILIFVSAISGDSYTASTMASYSSKKGPNKLPTCKAKEGFICPIGAVIPGINYDTSKDCVPPEWIWSAKQKEWRRTTEAKCKKMKKSICNSFYIEELSWHNASSQKWPPKKYGPNYLPLYPDGTPYKKYNPQVDALASCNPDLAGPYSGIARRNFDPPCDKVGADDEVVWLERYRAEYLKHNIAWESCGKNSSK